MIGVDLKNGVTQLLLNCATCYPGVACEVEGSSNELSAAVSLPSEGSKFCAIRRMRTSFGRGAKLAQQERHTMCRDERLRKQRHHGGEAD
jgi:hypothetical protein